MRELSSYHQLCNSAVELSPPAGASSDNSSPRSSTTDDDLLEISRSTEQGACGTSKPIYNFSIPDFIKHERQPVTSAANITPTEESLTVAQNTERPREVKRRHDQREAIETVNDVNTQGATSTSNCRKNKRRRVNQGTGDRSPEFIDLTDIADQDDTPSVRVLEEVNHSPYLDSSIVMESPRESTRNHIQMSDIAVTYESVADDLQRFRRRLRESRERIDQIRREFTARESRFRNRLSHRNIPCTEDQRIVSDGPAYTSQSDVDRESQRHQAAANATPFDYRSTEAPVITLDDDGETATPNHEREVTRMILEDSLYSPPFLTPYTSQRAPSLETIEERIGESRQRRLERAESVQRIRQQTQERINEVRNRLSMLDQHINNNDRQRIHIADSPQQESRQTEDEVEFLRELRPPQNIPTMPASELPRPTRSANTDVHGTNDSTYSWGHLSRRRRFSNLFSSADFLFPYVHFISPAATQRLHHFPSTFLDNGEDYEALWSLAERLGPAKPRGLSKIEIDRIQAFRYSQSRAEETNSTCVVCMSEYCFKEKIRKLPCTHDFHSKCIDKWLKSNKTCPVCRDEVKCI